MTMYAIISPTQWRVINDPADAVAGETVSDEIPPAPASKAFDAYCKAISDGVSAWLSEYVNKTYNYDGIVSAVSYLQDANPSFAAEAKAALQWRSDCFKALYAAMPTYEAMPPEQWPTIDYVTAHLPQPSAYAWEPTP